MAITSRLKNVRQAPAKRKKSADRSSWTFRRLQKQASAQGVYKRGMGKAALLEALDGAA